ncbi:unnamed protein product [Adineta ricciae]|uniref:Peptidase S53 domain-containing protein n=1 Tax=Adineta ricciae TaxID=249248 RepID=A0A813STI5_ADIRI|nr:unnamed protein product [Adineta ricciae]
MHEIINVALHAANYLNIVNGVIQSTTGTSAAAPVFASMIALINDYQLRHNRKRLGFLNPLLYRYASDLFNDITTGYNTGCNTTGFYASSGWDPLVPIGNDLCKTMMMMMTSSCTWIGLGIILIGSIGNWLCICVFFRKRFRSSMLTPFFVALLIADCIYLTFRVIKLLYYQQTLFQNFFSMLSCSSSLLIQIYAYFARHAPQIFVPLCHYEFYIRFSLILMSFLAVQRAYDMFHSSYRLMHKSIATQTFSYMLIVSALIVAYAFEFFGLSIFCSNELSAQTAYQWYDYIRTNLTNEMEHLVVFIKNNSGNQSEIDCLLQNDTNCSREQQMETVRHYFDMHQRPIVYLIHKYQLSTIGKKMARNELRLKYHYHTCPFRMQSELFIDTYDLLYSRTFGFNRYTIILVMGSIFPSIATILGNAISLQCIIAIRSSVVEQTRASRRRTDETRRVIIIITIECLLAVINSWFVDSILIMNYCRRSLAIGDDCPDFLRRSQTFLFLCDFLNSTSNIILHCFAGRRFRHELKRMLQAWINTIRKRIPCYCYIQWKKCSKPPKTYDDQFMPHSDSSTRKSKALRYPIAQTHEFIKLRVATYPTTVL